METRGEINAEIDKKIHEEMEKVIGVLLFGCQSERFRLERCPLGEPPLSNFYTFKWDSQTGPRSVWKTAIGFYTISRGG